MSVDISQLVCLKRGMEKAYLNLVATSEASPIENAVPAQLDDTKECLTEDAATHLAGA